MIKRCISSSVRCSLIHRQYHQYRCLSSYEPVSRKKGKATDGSDYDFEEVAKVALTSIKDAIEPLIGKIVIIINSTINLIIILYSS
jgi:hypothetical protein